MNNLLDIRKLPDVVNNFFANTKTQINLEGVPAQKTIQTIVRWGAGCYIASKYGDKVVDAIKDVCKSHCRNNHVEK